MFPASLSRRVDRGARLGVSATLNQNSHRRVTSPPISTRGCPMAVPQNKITKSRRNMRRAHDALVAGNPSRVPELRRAEAPAPRVCVLRSLRRARSRRAGGRDRPRRRRRGVSPAKRSGAICLIRSPVPTDLRPAPQDRYFSRRDGRRSRRGSGCRWYRGSAAQQSRRRLYRAWRRR